MMQLRAFKYLSPFLAFVMAWFAFNRTGWFTFLPVVYSYIVIPLLEVFISPSNKNLEAAEEEVARADKTYDYILYATVPLHFAALVYFLFSLQQPGLTSVEYIGRTISMGLLCGIFGINVAHELGHRLNRFEQTLAKVLLLSSQYMHFIVEHNKGHHKRVATKADPASARLHEPIFFFYGRSIIHSYISAWQIQVNDLKKYNSNFFSLKNEMLLFAFLQLTSVVLIYYFFGGLITTCYLLAAFTGIILLEAVNYIEHYGLSRKEIAPGKYERALPAHSWNSNHVIGRLMLFELSRHSDHHYLASRKYQVLRHHDESPQMPTGYPGMMLIAHIPPLFFWMMNRQMKKYQDLHHS